MIEKPMFIVITVYCISLMTLAGQYLIGDVFGLTLRNPDGVEIRSNLLAILDPDELNQITAAMAGAESQTNSTLAPIENAFNIGLFVGWELLTILTGTYIFNFLLLMGVPSIVIGGMLLVYFIMVGRTIIALVRGV